MTSVAIIIIAAFILRLFTLAFSIRNEKRLKEEGAVEYGQTNSKVMAVLHSLFYIGSLIYAIVKKVEFGGITVAGLALLAFSFIVLLIVMYQIRHVWTVKLLIAKGHKLKQSFIFKYIRHPNYFLNIIPELISITLICKSWIIFSALFPLYLITLVVRIVEEEKVMKQTFSDF